MRCAHTYLVLQAIEGVAGGGEVLTHFGDVLALDDLEADWRVLNAD